MKVVTCEEGVFIYKFLAFSMHSVLQKEKRPPLIVDWTCCASRGFPEIGHVEMEMDP